MHAKKKRKARQLFLCKLEARATSGSEKLKEQSYKISAIAKLTMRKVCENEKIRENIVPRENNRVSGKPENIQL